MCIRPPNLKNLYFPRLYLNNERVKVVTKEKYLGAFIVEDGSDDEDINRQLRSIYAHGNVLIRNFKKCSDDIKCSLFKTYCTSFYCSSLWAKFKAKSFSKIRTAYNNVFRHFMGIDRYTSISMTMINSRIDPFIVIIRKYIVSFMKRLNVNVNSIVNTVYNWNDFYTSTLYNTWLKKAFCTSRQ